MPPRSSPSLLPHYLVILYGLAIAYASLQPFSPWITPPPGAPFFLFAPWPPRWTRFDVIVNAVAYAPFGFFVALVPRRRPPLGRLSVAVAAGAAMSFAMETLQMFVPPRDASVIDLISNTAGAAIGGLAAVALARSRARHGVRSFRERWFVPGRLGDLGLALLAIWLAVQVNPGIPLFAIVFDPSPEFGAAVNAPLAAGTTDHAAALVEGAHSAFQLLGVGLFLSLLLRERRLVGGAVVLLIGAALAAKGIAAAILLKPDAWEHWLSPGVSTGVAAGALLLLTMIWLPRPVQVAVATIALLSSLLTTLLAPDLLFARAPLSLFAWSYGHLLHFNGLTHFVLLCWPLVATAYLFALAGSRNWGRAE
ncbi:MAG TPA: VanZ family protein [Casimicrobiaceae bacterium]|nr:VanZ family protein [Casimicrobiaceae bacterium]